MRNFLLILLAGIVIIETAELLGIIDLICEKGCDCEERYSGFEELPGGGAEVTADRVKTAEKAFITAYPDYKSGAMFSKKALDALFLAHPDHNAIFVGAGLVTGAKEGNLTYYLGSMRTENTLITRTGTSTLDAFVAEMYCPEECGIFHPY